MEESCDVCNSELSQKGEKEVAEIIYLILECSKCKKQVMRRKE